jgi:Tol biopolymer transport system component
MTKNLLSHGFCYFLITLAFLFINSAIPESFAEVNLINLVRIANSTGVWSPNWSPDGSKLAFGKGCDYTCGGAGLSLWLMNKDGSGEEELVHSVGYVANLWVPDWNPIEGSKIVYCADRVGDDKRLWIVDVNTRLTNQLTFGFSEDWSPDGTKIAFGRGYGYYTHNVANIWVIDPYTLVQYQVTFGDNGDEGPAWNPQGTKIAFHRMQNETGYTQVYTMNSDGTNIQRLTDGPYHSAGPTWSRDGSYIAYVSKRELWVMNSDGSGKKQLTANLGRVGAPQWSPTEDIIAFQNGPFGCCAMDAYLAYLSVNKCPAANAGPNISILSEGQTASTVQGAASDPDNDAMTCRWLEGENELISWQPVGPNGECPLDLGPLPDFLAGEHILTLEVNDGKCTSEDEMILTVNNSAPHPAPSGGGVCEINTQFALGGQVSDFDGDPVSYEWLEGGNLLFNGSVSTIYGGQPVDLPGHIFQCLVLGNHEVTLTAFDGVNTTIGSIPINIQVVDTTLPTLSPVSDKNILWPPNHKMVNVTITANARDNSGGLVTLSALVFSNEPQEGLDSGDTSPDWTTPIIDQVNGIITLQLRAERSGNGSGRVYTVVIRATDQSGNSSQAAVDIIVPHDQRNK